MKEEKFLDDKFGRKGPWTVPDGYFDTMREQVMSKLPEYPAQNKPADLSVWQRIKPYVYLAAMFAGIWCMMKVFHNAAGNASLSLDNPPEHIAAYIGEMDDDDIYLIPSSLSDEEVLDDMSGYYNNIEDFEKDFGYNLKPEYANIKL